MTKGYRHSTQELDLAEQRQKAKQARHTQRLQMLHFSHSDALGEFDDVDADAERYARAATGER